MDFNFIRYVIHVYILTPFHDQSDDKIVGSTSQTALQYYIHLRDTIRLSKNTYCQGLEGKGPKGTKHLLRSRPYQ